MLPIRKIIAPTDFSEASKYGLKAAVEMAGKFDAELIVVHVNVRPIIGFPRSPYEKDEIQSKVDVLLAGMEDEIRSQLEKLVAELVPKTVRCSIKILDGPAAAQELERLAREENANLIVISTHGYSGFNRFVFGSVTEKVVRTAPCSVLTAKPREQA